MFLLFVLCVVFTTGNGNPAKFSEVAPRLLYGTKAAPGQFPFIVLLQFLDGQPYRCGGTILNENWVLTAAHCVTKSQSVELVDEMKVYAGVTDTNVREMVRNGQQLIPHPKYNPYTLSDDIALIKIDKQFIWSRRVQPLRKLGRVGPYQDVTAMGYGLGSMDHLSYMKTKTQECSGESICIKNPNSSICGGDSGSPLININGELVGLASGNEIEGCVPNIKTFFTRVYPYANWIKGVTKIQNLIVY